MQVAYMESSYFRQPPHCCVEKVGKFGPDRHRLVASICSGSTVAVSPPVLPTILDIPPQPLRCMKTEPAHTCQAGVGQDHPLLRFCDLDIFKLMNFEAKVLHENGIRPRLRKSPLNLKQHLRTPTWRVPVSCFKTWRCAHCFLELRMKVTCVRSSYLCQPPHSSVEQVGKFGPVWLPPFAQGPQLTFLQFSPSTTKMHENGACPHMASGSGSRSSSAQVL